MRNSSAALAALVLLLLAVGTSMTAYQAFVLGLPLEPASDQKLWTVEARIEFRPERGRPILAQLLVPSREENLIELGESFISRGYGVTIENEGPNRKVVWSVRRASGTQALYYRVVLGTRVGIAAMPTRTPDSVEIPELDGAESLATRAILQSVRNRSANIRTFTAETIRSLNNRDDDNARALVGRTNSSENIARAALLVLHSARIPAEIIHALPLREGSQVEPETLVASHNGDDWGYYDTSSGRRRDPGELLVWWAGDSPLLEVEGGRAESVRFTIMEKSVASLELADEIGRLRSSGWMQFSLSSLPLQTQQLYQILFVLPVGVAIIVLLRTFVGIETFGTFMPALIALSFRETELWWGLGLFTILLLMGMTIRAALDQLRLLLVPRMAVMLTFVLLIMAGISVVSHRMGVEHGLSVALFPMVIVAMTIERMSITWEERGGLRAFLVALGSLAAAALAYLAMSNALINHIVVTFPGTLLILIALLLLAGAYRGYRIAELMRFRSFAERN